MHYAFQTEDMLCFVMDWISGGDLWFHLKKEKNGFPKKVARFFAAELVLAIEHLHSFSGKQLPWADTLIVVYRDLKPENVLIDSEGHVVLVFVQFALF